MVDETLVAEARQVDLLTLIGSDTHLHKVANTRGGEYAGPCPFCGGQDRLRVQPERGLWWCRQCSGENWRDAIAYLERRDNLTFAEAIQRLTNVSMPPRKQTDLDKPKFGPPSEDWQAIARQVIAQSEKNLWSDLGNKARVWLNARGLDDDTLHHWHIGFNPTNQRISGLYVERGIVIPCVVNDMIWYVKIRRPLGEPKYIQIKGSRPALFGADLLARHEYAVITEGEFDAMLVWQICVNGEYPPGHKRDLVGVATLGSAASRLDVDTWAQYLLPVARFLVCYDADEAGVKGARFWNELTTRARRVNVPTLRPNDKDLTDYHLAGGRIIDLVSFEMARDRWQSESEKQSQPNSVSNDLAKLKTQRDQLTIKWNEAMDVLDAMRDRKEQDTSEFGHLSKEWITLDEEYRRLCDRIDCLESTEQIRQ